MEKEFINSLDEKGYAILKNIISSEWVSRLNAKLDKAFSEHRQVQVKNNNDIVTGGVALHVVLSDEIFLEFLQELIDLGIIETLEKEYFKSKLILNSFSGLDNLPNQTNFSALVHRDLRFYTGDIPAMLNMLVMLDDFTEENGPTLLLPFSHKKEEKPTDEYFHANAIKALGRAGDILIFNSNVWHASSLNTTQGRRRALPLTFTKPLIKQLLDYPRALGYERMDEFNVQIQQLLGYHARVPANLEEWYQPFEKRFYKKNQD